MNVHDRHDEDVELTFEEGELTVFTLQRTFLRQNSTLSQHILDGLTNFLRTTVYKITYVTSQLVCYGEKSLFACGFGVLFWGGGVMISQQILVGCDGIFYMYDLFY